MVQYILHLFKIGLQYEDKIGEIVHYASIIIPNPEGFLSTHRNCYYCFPPPPVLPILILLLECVVVYLCSLALFKKG